MRCVYVYGKKVYTYPFSTYDSTSSAYFGLDGVLDIVECYTTMENLDQL